MHRFYVCSLFTVQADDSDSPLDNMDSTANPGDGVTWNKAKTETGNMGPGAEEAGQGPRHGQGHQQREHLREYHHHGDHEVSVPHRPKKCIIADNWKSCLRQCFSTNQIA